MDKQVLLSHLTSFGDICRFIEQHDPETILQIVSEYFGITPEELAVRSMGAYSRIAVDSESFSKDSGAYIYVLLDLKQNLGEYKYVYSLLVDDISRDVFLNQMRYRLMPAIDYIRAAYELSAKYPQYFDEEINSFGEDEVFVDCGGYTGDTSEKFIKLCGNYKHIYVYEPLDENFVKCEENLSGYRDVTIRKAGVGKKSSRMGFGGGGASGSFAAISGQNSLEDIEIEIVSLDEDIKEPVTFIKMDVECFEPDAILGAAGHIREDMPKLAICLYHMVSDIWEIPKLINGINPCYNYYLRHYDNENNWEYVLYAIPGADKMKFGTMDVEFGIRNSECGMMDGESKIRNLEFGMEDAGDTVAGEISEDVAQGLSEFLAETDVLIEHIDELPPDTSAELYDMYVVAAKKATENIGQIDSEIRVVICDRLDQIVDRIVDFDLLPPEHERERTNVYTPAVHNYRRWGNVELLKDKGLTGYLLAKEIEAEAVMFFGTKTEDYPYLAQLPGLEVLYSDSESGDANAYFDHLLEHYRKMDVLVLHGMHEQTMIYLDAYRKLRPDGKVYCGLDMNSYWMGIIDWDRPAVRNFASQCDIIATSCRYIRDVLNRNNKAQFPCRWIPNGFYDTTCAEIVADPDRKKNVIITVGRIGDVQKNNSELLTAFAGVADALPDWQLRFIGPVEPEFRFFVDSLFKKQPKLKGRVVLTGAIADKAGLYEEYASAKVFALTSRQEGGTPNVYAEALIHGCMFITSSIDAADDITNFGELGIKYPLGDVMALSKALLQICSNADKSAFEKHIPKALSYAEKHFDWHRNAKKLAYMLYN